METQIAQVVAAVAEAQARCGDIRVVAIDGPSGAGKSTLAAAVVQELRCPLVQMDELFPGWEGLAQGVDVVHQDVLLPLARGEQAGYRRWDWERDAWAPWVTVPRPDTGVIVIEGCGCSVRPAGNLAAVRVWVDADWPTRLRRGLARDGEAYRTHWERWARQERDLFAADGTRERADLRFWTGERAPAEQPGC